jgi:hypothetical protein
MSKKKKLNLEPCNGINGQSLYDNMPDCCIPVHFTQWAFLKLLGVVYVIHNDKFKNGRNDDKTVQHNVLQTYRSAAVCNITEYSTHWYRRLGGLKNWSGCFGVEKNRVPLLGIEPLILIHPANRLVTIPIDWFQLLIVVLALVLLLLL